jgi:regulator of replication initiation timing
MTDPKTLLDENIRLKKEIEILNSRLARVSVWIEREIKEQAHKIAKTKASKMNSEVREEFLNENFEEMIAKQINSYF